MTATGVPSPLIGYATHVMALKSLFEECLVCKSWIKLWDKAKNAAHNRYIVATCISSSSSKSICLYEFLMFLPISQLKTSIYWICMHIVRLYSLFSAHRTLAMETSDTKKTKMNYDISNLIALWSRSVCACAGLYARKESELCAL